MRNESAAGGVLIQLSFSGGLSVQEATSAGVVQVELLRGSDWGGGGGGVLYSIRGTAFSFNAYNSRGDVVSTSDASGTATWQAAYEAFGTRTAENGSNADRQRANTKDEDPTGLLNEGFRYRDLEAGVFISRDPLGFVDGPNVYAYVRQNPWSFSDPLGLSCMCLATPMFVGGKTLEDGNVIAGAWAGLARGLNDLGMMAAHAGPSMWLDAGISKLVGQKSGLQEIRESTAAHNAEVSKSIAQVTGTDAEFLEIPGRADRV